MKPMQVAFGVQPGPDEPVAASLHAYAAGVGPWDESASQFMLGITAEESQQGRKHTFVFYLTRDQVGSLGEAINRTLLQTAEDTH